MIKQVISTSNAPAAIGPYSQAILIDNTLYASGQLGIDPDSGDFVPGGAKEQTEQIFQNIKAVLATAGMTLADVVKTTCFLADMADFTDMNVVYARHFEGLTFPARSAVAVRTLPKNALIEIEILAIKG